MENTMCSMCTGTKGTSVPNATSVVRLRILFFSKEHYAQCNEDHKCGHCVKEIRRLDGVIHRQPHSERDDSRYVEAKQHRKETQAGSMHRTCLE